MEISTAPFRASCEVANCSLTAIVPRAITRQINIVVKIAMPCFLFFTALPNVKHNAAGISRIEIISMRLVNALGFSNGCAELTPMNPPPLVPDCLIATWLAAGPIGTNCSVTMLTAIFCPAKSTVPVLSSLEMLDISESARISLFSTLLPRL